MTHRHSDSVHERPLIENDIDAYRSKRKLSGNKVCPNCHAILTKGYWRWGAAPVDAKEAMCPACQRQKDKFPAGFLTLEGETITRHGDEVLKLLHRKEAHEKSEHPLQRIIDITKNSRSIVVTTTDMHLARALGEAIKHAYQGQLDLQYNEGESLLRAYWKG